MKMYREKTIILKNQWRHFLKRLICTAKLLPHADVYEKREELKKQVSAKMAFKSDLYEARETRKLKEKANSPPLSRLSTRGLFLLPINFVIKLMRLLSRANLTSWVFTDAWYPAHFRKKPLSAPEDLMVSVKLMPARVWGAAKVHKLTIRIQSEQFTDQ